MTAQQALVEIANNLRDDDDWEEAEYQLHLRKKLEQAEGDIREGRLYDTDQARAYVWTKSALDDLSAILTDRGIAQPSQS